ncbi:Hypothetical predicted protein [Mytilus galloprovincialis]|nr:Hypothetical predicted protein [Mytilus galloprovincialis]
MATKFFPLFFVFLTVHGFLLDKSQSANGQLGTSNQYVTALEFLDETKSRHQEDEQIRHYVDKSLAVLSSQLEQKFHTLEQQLIKCENQTDSTLSNESLEQKYLELENKYNQLQTENKVLQTEQNLMTNELRLLRNRTGEMSSDFKILKQLGNIKPLQEIQTLKQAVQTVSAQTHSLSVNERARGQDFLALYNMTIDSKRALSELTTNTSNHLMNFEMKTSTQLSNLEVRQNSTAADMSNKFQAVIALNTNTSNRLQSLETKTNKQLSRIEQSQNSTAAAIITRMEAKEISDNLTMSMVQKQINNNAERVAMTAHPSNSGTVAKTIMKFNDVKFSVGITNLVLYKTTGKFTCEHEGLYLISASVTSYTSNAYFFINLNGNHISYTYIGEHSSTYGHTGAVTVTRKLNPNDQVWLYASGSWYLYSGLESKLTIIKIK